MKKIITAAAFFILFLTGYSQQKYGHIDSQEILDAMPEYKQMKAALEKKRKEQEAKLKSMYKDYERRQKELTEYAAGLMEAVREEKMIELDSLTKAISAYEDRIDSDMDALQMKLLKPMNDKYLKIVDAVAKENGYTYIFDIATGSLAYYPPNDGNITGLVKKKMGITQ
ncbi:MAG: OmpH family outer membrane protein [Chitinophagales bacterium]|nr:OmpH family outer membrane protein [Chitinophagales bacterium]